MIYPNKPPADYRYKCFLHSQYDRAANEEQRVFTSLRILTGTDYNPGIHGIEVVVDNYVYSTDPYKHRIFLETPWGFFTLLNEETFKEFQEVYVELDQAKIVTDCSEWTFTADALRVYYKNEENDIELLYTKTGILDTGSGFDRRYCTVYGASSSTINPAKVYNFPGCLVFAEPFYSRVEAISSKIGWQIKVDGVWTSKPVKLYQLQGLPAPELGTCTACTCSDTLPSIVIDPILQSYDIELYSIDLQNTSIGPNFQVSCSCICPGPPPVYCGNPFVYNLHEERHEYKTKTSWIYAAPTDAELFEHKVTTQTKCWCLGVGEPPFTTDGPNTYTLGETYASSYQSVSHLLSYRNCGDIYVQGSCPPIIIGQPNPIPPEENCGASNPFGCAYRATKLVEWITSGCECLDPDIHGFKDGSILVACTDQGYLKIKYRPTAFANYLHSTIAYAAEQVTQPCILRLPNRHTIVTFSKNTPTPGVYYAYSFDSGRTISTPQLLIPNGMASRITCTPQGDILFAAIVGNNIRTRYKPAGTHTPNSAVTIKDDTNTNIVIDPDYGFGLSVAHGMSQCFVLTCVLDGQSSESTWYSFDKGKTWKRKL